MRFIGLLLATILISLPALAAEPVKCPEAPSHMVVEKGRYSPFEGVTFALEGFVARMVPRGNSVPLCLIKVNEIQRGRVFLTGESLTRLFNQRTQGKKRSIDDVKIETKGEHVIISGKVKKLVPVPFEIEGPVSSAGPHLRVEAKKIEAAGLPVKGLLNMLGAELGSIVGGQTEGVTVNENTLTFRPENLANIRGQIAAVNVTSEGLAVTFGAPAQKQNAKQTKREK